MGFTMRTGYRWLWLAWLPLALGCARATMAPKLDDAFLKQVADDPFPTASQAGVLRAQP